MLGDFAGQLAILTEETPANRVRRIVGYARNLVGFRVDDAGMPASMAHIYRVVFDDFVYVVAVQRSLVFKLGIVVHDAADPVTGRCIRRFARERFFDIVDASQVDVDSNCLLCKQRVTMRVDKSGRHCHATTIDSHGVCIRKKEDFCIRPNRKDPVALNGNRLRHRLVRVHCQDFRTCDDHAGDAGRRTALRRRTSCETQSQWQHS